MIYRLSTTRKKYGGSIYEQMIDVAIAKHFSYKVVDAGFALTGYWRIFEGPLFLFRLLKCHKIPNAILIRPFQGAFIRRLTGTNSTKCVSLIFHVDSTFSSLASKLFQDFLEWAFLRQKQFDHPIVVISEFWQKWFESKGYTNVHKIYCGFDLQQYQISNDEVSKFKEKYKLANAPGCPLVYIGNPQLKKGADQVYAALKNLDVELITSGIGDIDLPIKNLQLGFREYLCLLKAAQVVITMSCFLEGWNRVAHEAMLVGTPVVGSGMGGMGELLTGGGQIICSDFGQLPGCLEKAIVHRTDLVNKGRVYAENFSVERFEKQWVELIQNLQA